MKLTRLPTTMLTAIMGLGTAQAAEVESQLAGRDYKDGGASAADLARRGSALDAPTGLGTVLAGNSSAEEKATVALTMAGRGMFFKAAQLLGAAGERPEVLQVLVGNQAGRRLAAASLAAQATMASLVAERAAARRGAATAAIGAPVSASMALRSPCSPACSATATARSGPGPARVGLRDRRLRWPRPWRRRRRRRHRPGRDPALPRAQRPGTEPGAGHRRDGGPGASRVAPIALIQGSPMVPCWSPPRSWSTRLSV